MKREKICENPDCKEVFTFKSSKKKYCDTSCKNHHDFLKRLVKYKELYLLNKIYLKNFKIIETQYNNGITSLSEHDMMLLGFDHNVKPINKKTENGFLVYVFENYYLKYENDQVLIVKYK